MNEYIGDGSDPAKGIAVIGITDYLSIDNYLRVIKDDKLPRSVAMVMPNVELRISPISKNGPTNIHCIFNPDFADKLESRFFSNLKFSYDSVEYPASKSGLIDFAKKYLGDPEVSYEKAMEIAIEQFVVQSDKLEKVFKPCIHGSDAHTNKELFEPEEKRYCWIKANPTFNGFKQILYEPEERVKISPIIPENKRDYQVIDSVTFTNELFQKESIYFNDNLNCVIGGKSTGKSLLLNNMAYAIDSRQVEKKISVSSANLKTVEKVIVKWKDGKESAASNKEDEHKIVYIPQTYLNRLSDNEEEETEIGKIIHDIVVSNSDISNAFSKMQNELKIKKSDYGKKIYDFIQKHEEIVQCEDGMKNLGTKDGIESELEKLNSSKASLVKDLSLSEEDIKEYDKAVAEAKCFEEEIRKIDHDIQLIDSIDIPLIEKPLLGVLSDQTNKQYEQALTVVESAAKEAWDAKKGNILKNLSDNRSHQQTELEKRQNIINALTPKIEENNAVSELSIRILAEESKLKEFKDKEKELIKLKNEFEVLLDELVSSWNVFLGIHDAYAAVVNNGEANAKDDLEFKVISSLRKESFVAMLEESFDKRVLKKGLLAEIQEDASLENIRLLVKGCISGEYHLIKGKNNEVFLRDLLSDWYNTAYQVKMDGDLIDDMSPGKKALVLLKMLINLAESKCPILIDQPEDDLDNRSIFYELIPFIKEKKKDRQIIVVTHNANVVLGGDAEEIIIANHEGKNSRNEKYTFEYRTGAIEDESFDSDAKGILKSQGIQQHICDVLEGGKDAFDLRKNKYRM